MRVKIGTSIDKDLLTRAQRLASRRGQNLNEMLEAALLAYLQIQERLARGDVVGRTWGIARVDAQTLQEILDEDLYDA